jgi:putative peptidoglycan lipid II flippase
VVLLVATLVALVGWQAATTLSGERRPGAAGTLTSAPAGPSPSTPAPRTGQERATSLPITAISDVDPQGDGQESPDEVGYAVDGDPATAWTTRAYYRRPDLGGLKGGVGLLLDLGTVTEVAAVDLRLRGTGTAVDLARGDSATAPVPGGYTVLARARAAGPRVSFVLDAPVNTRYLLVWLTRLPPDGPDTFRGGVAELTGRGMPPTAGGVG